MVYLQTSVKPVIGRVIRNTRMTDMTYADDILEWIGEALNRMLIRWRLEATYKVLDIKDYSATLPCGLVTLNGVLYNGCRLRKGTASYDVRIGSWSELVENQESYFVHDTTIQSTDINAQNYTLLRGQDLKQVSTADSSNFYQLQYGTIKTSFKEGQIVIFYKIAPVDKEGYPLVPDLEEARQALFWYVCSMLAFSGYKLPNPEHNYEFCEFRAEKFFRKAKDIIKEQSEDEKEATVQLLNNLIPPPNYYESFFAGGEQSKYTY